MLKTLIHGLMFIWGSFCLCLYISAIAPQNSVLMYFAQSEQYSDIFIYDTNFHLRLNLTNSFYPEWRGTWSETGLFAYTANASSRENAILFISQDYAAPSMVESIQNELIFDATIAPNGEKLLFISSEPANYSEIFLVGLLIGEQSNLSQTPSLSESEPQWFGNEALVFLREGNLYKMDLAQRSPELLIDEKFLIENIKLSPNQQYIAYHALILNERQLYIANSDGTNIQAISLPQSLSSESLSWSPDSNAIAFTLLDGSLKIYEITNQSLLSFPSPARRSSPLWSPDGRSIAFMENRRPHLLEWKTGAIIALDETRLIRPPLLWIP